MTFCNGITLKNKQCKMHTNKLYCYIHEKQSNKITGDNNNTDAIKCNNCKKIFTYHGVKICDNCCFELCLTIPI